MTLKYILILVLYMYVKYIDVLNAVVIGRYRREDGQQKQWRSHLCYVRQRGIKISIYTSSIMHVMNVHLMGFNKNKHWFLTYWLKRQFNLSVLPNIWVQKTSTGINDTQTTSILETSLYLNISDINLLFREKKTAHYSKI